MLTDILSHSEVSKVPKQDVIKNGCDTNSSTQSEPSPPFESIAECDIANTSNYSMLGKYDHPID